ncbi:hypothetical protein DR082_01235 [Mycoplasma flocculare]|nr:hypothetical protein [Mesomycoplasma flocculare]
MMWGNPLGNNKIPTIAELWKNEKKQYRIWIFSYPILLALLAILLGVRLFLNFDIKSFGLVSSILSILFTAATLFFYIISLFISYKEKDFSMIGNRSFFVNLVAFSLSVLSIVNSTIAIINDLNTGDKNFALILAIQIILVSLIFILIPYFYTRVLKIKSIFKLSHSIITFEQQISELKKDPQAFSKFMNIFDLNQDVANLSKNGNSANFDFDASQDLEQNNKKPRTKNEKIKITLEKLPFTNLHEIAEKLEISGYQDLKKQELIELLTRILAQQENKK